MVCGNAIASAEDLKVKKQRTKKAPVENSTTEEKKTTKKRTKKSSAETADK